MKAAARLAAFIGIGSFFVCLVFAPEPVTASRSRRVVSAVSVARQPAPESDDRDDGTVGVVDLYGNEVTDAVAEYTLDAGGSLYEEHSPHTDLPRLGPAKT